MIARFGGRYLVARRRGDASRGHAGASIASWCWNSPAWTALKTFYHSPDYAPLIALRQAASDGDVALIEGYAPG